MANRPAALRMCEERSHVIECVRRGMESDGFQLYERLSSGELGARGATYRLTEALLMERGRLARNGAPETGNVT